MKNENKTSQRTEKGFTLIETLVAVFIFALAITVIAGTFSAFVKNYSQAKKVQRAVENAQYTMNLMAKTIRTSYVASPATVGFLNIYDYSQSRCIAYRRNGNVIQSGSNLPAIPGDPETCNYAAISFNDLTADNIAGVWINAIPTSTASPFTLGKVTLSLRIESGTSPVNVQMSVSLRQ